MGLAPANYGFLRNCRAYLPERYSPRGGMQVISPTPFDQTYIHTIRRLNDATLNSFARVYGAGTKLYVGEGTPAVDSGYSGNPLSLMPFRPDQSPRAWMYVGDSLKMSKVNILANSIRSMGMEPPLGAPTVEIGPDVILPIAPFFSLGSWTNGPGATAPTLVARTNTTITAILYDSGTTGFACVQAGASGLSKGQLMFVNSGGSTAEDVLIQQVRQALSPTTIQNILYDSGTTGLCTIQPAAATVAKSNVGLGAPVATPRRVNLPTRNVRPLTNPPTPPPPAPRNPSTQPTGLQPDMMLLLNQGQPNAEYVRVISVTIGPSGQASFRCSTVNTHTASEPIKGVPSFRAFFLRQHFGGETLQDGAIASTISAGTGSLQNIQNFNLAVAPPNPIQETDNIHLAVFMDHPEYLSECKIYFDVGDGSFTQNYFYATMRQNDAQQAVSSQQTAIASRQAAITKLLTNTYGLTATNPRLVGPVITPPRSPLGGTTPNPPSQFQSGGSVPNSVQASTGSSQWSDFLVKVQDLVRVGADMSLTLASVTAIRIQFQVSAAANVQIADFWIGGTYGPSIGTLGSPLFYRFRGFDSTTGVRSLAGPATRSGIEPQNQLVLVTGAQHPNPSCDTIQVYRWGGSLTEWYYVGSTPNVPNWVFQDQLSDTDIASNPTLETDVFQPFPTIDLPRKGLCATAGTKVINVSGDSFNPRWYPGAQININGQYYTLYAQPPGDGTLEILENAGTQGYSQTGIGRLCSVGAQSGAGTAWSNPQNVTSQVAGQYATVVGLAAGAVTQVIFCTGFGFNIPANAIIVGFVVGISGLGIFPNGNAAIFEMQMLKNASAAGVVKNLTGVTAVIVPYSLPTNQAQSDLWGATWSPADINNPNFGVSLAVSNAGGAASVNASVNGIVINVYYLIPTGTPFFLNQATLLAQPLPALWGPFAEGTAAFCFGCGDTFQPGVLFITNGNNPDAASDTLQEEVTPPTEPLMNGCMYNGTPFVWSSDRFFRLNPNLGVSVTTPTLLDPSAQQLFIPQEIIGAKGLFAQFCFAVGDLMYYRSKDGIYGSNGSSSTSTTNKDLYLLFPHDGQPGQPVTIGSYTFQPPDDTQPNKQRLSFYDQVLYFDYIDINGVQRSIFYDPITDIWSVDDYTPTVSVHYGDEGKGIHNLILGGTDGRAYLCAGNVDGNGMPFPVEQRMPQLSELATGYTVPYDGFLGLIAPATGQINLVVNVDGADNIIPVPVGTSYFKTYVRLLALKGKILAFGLVSSAPFTNFLRDCQFRCGEWGRDGLMSPINPFSSPRRAQAPKIG